MENNKNSKGLIVLVIVLIICVLGLGGYIVYDKLHTKPTQTTDNTKSSTTQLISNNDIKAVSTITSRECAEEMLNAIVNKDNELYFVLDNKQIKIADIKVKEIEFVNDLFACDENKLLILSQNGDLYYANHLFYDVKDITKKEIHISELKNTKLISENIDLISGVIDDEKGISVDIINKDKELKNIILLELETTP